MSSLASSLTMFSKLRTALGLAVLLLLGQTYLHAGGWPRFSLPMAAAKNKSGLHITVEGDGLDANGYRPIRVEVRPWPPTKPWKADRHIRVVLAPRTYSGVNTPAVSQIIELPEGGTSAKVTISVPQTAIWGNMGITTYEDSHKLEDLSVRYMGWGSRNNWEWTEAHPTMLFIDPDVPSRVARDAASVAFQTTGADPTPTHNLPDVRSLVWAFRDANTAMASGSVPAYGNVATDVMLLSQIDSLDRVEMLPPTELPRRWIDLSQYDVIVVSAGDLKLLADQYQPELAAIRDWLATGRLLLIIDSGKNYERLPDIARQLELAALKSGTDDSDSHGWTLPDPKEDTDTLKSAFSAFNARATPGPIRISRRFKRPIATPKTANSTPAATTTALPDAPSAGPPFLYRAAGLGCVVAIESANPFVGRDVPAGKGNATPPEDGTGVSAAAAATPPAAGTQAAPEKKTDWIWIFNSVPESNWRWFRRNGFSLHRTNDDYWAFLVPGVGEAPVFSFLVLVSLFVIVIGPMNYALLTQARRLYLLLITVPAGAALVTLALFAYALTSDGLGVRLRSRSFTEIDQRSGRAAVWSHQSYYAAIAPSGGLVFPADATVFPICYQPALRNRSGETDSELDWSDSQNLRAGYMPSRTATQLMIERATKTEARLVVKEGAKPSDSPRVENRLQAEIRYLLLRNTQGDYYTTKSLADQKSADLVATDTAEAEKELEGLSKSSSPEMPHGYDPNLHNNTLSFFYPDYRGWMNVDASVAQPNMDTSLLETNISACLQPSKYPLVPGTYVAIVQQSPVVPVGVPQVREEASLHVIRGSY